MNNLRPFLLAIASVILLSQTAQAHYDPNIGRFINRDTIAEEDGVNLYGFVHNNPKMFVDRFGEDGVPVDRYGRPWMPGTPNLPPPPPPSRPMPNHENSYNVFGSTHILGFQFKNDHCVCDCETIADQIYSEMKRFSNWGKNSVANISWDPWGDLLFDPLGAFTTVMNAGMGNNSKWPVSLNYDDPARTITARTLTGHAIVGLRTWTVTISSLNPCSIKVHTTGLEKGDSFGNAAARPFVGEEAQKTIWNEYFQNIQSEWKMSPCYLKSALFEPIQWDTKTRYNPWLGE